jgi:DNA-binding NtrC family response regulator
MTEDMPTALVADSSAAESGALARALLEIGYRVICAATPLEMIHHLEHRRGDIELIVLGASLGRCEGDELASFLAEAHPTLRRVIVARRTSGARSATPGAKAILDSVIEKPWIHDLLLGAPAAPEVGAVGCERRGDEQEG